VARMPRSGGTRLQGHLLPRALPCSLRLCGAAAAPATPWVMRLSAAWLPALLALIPCPSAQEPDPTSCPDLTGDLLVDVEVSAITILAARETASCFSH
jgi:hypothetical protein